MTVGSVVGLISSYKVFEIKGPGRCSLLLNKAIGFRVYMYKAYCHNNSIYFVKSNHVLYFKQVPSIW